MPAQEWSYEGDRTLPLVVSYHTNEFYLREAYELARTCRTLNLSHLIARVTDQGSWEKNTNYKPTWLRVIARRYHHRPIVWVDADARIRKHPILFQELDAKGTLLAYHTWRNEKPASGTVYLGPTSQREEFLACWEKEVSKDPEATDQICMARAALRRGFPHYELPVAYCWIFDAVDPNGINLSSDPVIEHMQASRFARKLDKATRPVVKYHKRRRPPR